MPWLHAMHAAFHRPECNVRQTTGPYPYRKMPSSGAVNGDRFYRVRNVYRRRVCVRSLIAINRSTPKQPNGKSDHFQHGARGKSNGSEVQK
jgi:hypothetical protein